MKIEIKTLDLGYLIISTPNTGIKNYESIKNYAISSKEDAISKVKELLMPFEKPAEEETKIKFMVGDDVYAEKWGDGVVIDIRNNTDHSISGTGYSNIVVSFKDHKDEKTFNINGKYTDRTEYDSEYMLRHR